MTKLRTTKDSHRDALVYVLRAWDDAIEHGIDPDFLANAALFAALSDLVSAYGEQAVTHLAAGLPDRIQRGEFTVATDVLQ